jgi:hypothetical protein
MQKQAMMKKRVSKPSAKMKPDEKDESEVKKKEETSVPVAPTTKSKQSDPKAKSSTGSTDKKEGSKMTQDSMLDKLASVIKKKASVQDAILHVVQVPLKQAVLADPKFQSMVMEMVRKQIAKEKVVILPTYLFLKV